MKHHASFVVISCLLLLLTSCHTVFDSCKSSYTIIVDPDASECVNYSAEELQNWVREVSNTDIRIVNDLSAGQLGKRLVVGYNDLTRKAFRDAGSPDGVNDSFTYASVGGDIYFWGDTDRGTLYSVYSFLERELGCRWYNSRVSLAPKRDSWSFRRLYNHEEPAIRVRDAFYYDVLVHPEFAARVRSNSNYASGDKKYGGALLYRGCHSIPFYVPDSLFESHPEYFGEINGRRMKKTQRCFSNPEVLAMTIEGLRKTMREEPQYLVYSVEQGDGEPSCECAACKAIKARYGNQESGVLLWFVNQVADAVKDEFPDKFIGTFAYQQTRHCPENIVPRDNVVIRLCSIEACQIHKFDECEENRAFVKDLEQWPSIAKSLYIWDYTTTFSNFLLSTPNFWTFQDRMRRFRDANAIGVMPQGSYLGYSTAFEDMKVYLLTKLMWNPECDVEEVIRDFTDGFFGPDAGPIIREYLEFEKTLVTDDNHETIYLSDGADLYNDEFIAPAKEYFERAKQAICDAGGDNVDELVARVEYAEITICCLELLRLPEQGMADGSMDLLKRVCEREGICRWREFGHQTSVDDLIEIIKGNQPMP